MEIRNKFTSTADRVRRFDASRKVYRVSFGALGAFAGAWAVDGMLPSSVSGHAQIERADFISDCAEDIQKTLTAQLPADVAPGQELRIAIDPADISGSCDTPSGRARLSAAAEGDEASAQNIDALAVDVVIGQDGSPVPLAVTRLTQMHYGGLDDLNQEVENLEGSATARRTLTVPVGALIGGALGFALGGPINSFTRGALSRNNSD